ncbi:hypothetical protein SeLEV6574_g04874 [Synchytrium endobioticum]|uniref:Uncharacterized protein n=1 Tax=Synchytrium endobioticum TaxID=286115 RepID=A0A507CX58_9FUNG|nr:hypothetical protein SeLEV6574_g04874 [Synchytrium endobioticum]
MQSKDYTPPVMPSTRHENCTVVVIGRKNTLESEGDSKKDNDVVPNNEIHKRAPHVTCQSPAIYSNSNVPLFYLQLPSKDKNTPMKRKANEGVHPGVGRARVEGLARRREKRRKSDLRVYL